MGFFLSLAAMLVLAVAFIVLPARRAMRHLDAGVDSQRQRNREVVQERLLELDADLLSGRLDSQQHLALKNELLATLLGDEDQAPQPASNKPEAPFSGVSVALTVVIFAAACLLLYRQIGAWPDMQIAASMKTLATIEDPALRQQQLQEIVAKTSRRLQGDSDNDSYTYLLAQGQMELQRYPEAASNYGRLAKKVDTDARLWANYAQAQYLADERALSAPTKDALEKALRLDPQQSSALGLMGMHAFENGEFGSAAKAWRRLLGGLSPGSQQHQIIAQALQRAESLGGIAATATQDNASDKPAAAADASAASLTVEVSTSLNGIPANATVFIYARAAQGPKMPLAIQRRAASDLPLTVELNDSMAMMPSMKLSAFDNIEIIARISPSGSASPQSGDWQASSGAVTRSAIEAPIALDIRKKLP